VSSSFLETFVELRNSNPSRPFSKPRPVPRHPVQIYGEPGPCHQKNAGRRGRYPNQPIGNRLASLFVEAAASMQVQSSPVQFSSPWRLGLQNRGFLWFRWKKKGQRTKQTQSMIESETVSTWGKQSPGPHPLCLHLPSPSQSAIAAPGGRRIASKLTKLHHSEDLGSAGSFFLDILLETDRG
jgi:hypothetical protein